MQERYPPQKGGEIVDILLRSESKGEEFDEECNYTDDATLKSILAELWKNDHYVLPVDGVPMEQIPTQ